MGTSYCAFAVLGCEVTGKLYRDVEIGDWCAHNPGAWVGTLAKFCPQCGKAQTKIERRPIEQFDPDDGILNGLKVAFAGNRAGLANFEMRAFAGIVVETDWDSECATRMAIPIEPHALDERAAIVQQALEEIGMWDPDSFGLWAVLAAG